MLPNATRMHQDKEHPLYTITTNDSTGSVMRGSDEEHGAADAKQFNVFRCLRIIQMYIIHFGETWTNGWIAGRLVDWDRTLSTKRLWYYMCVGSFSNFPETRL